MSDVTPAAPATPAEPEPIDNSTRQPDIAAQRASDAAPTAPAAPKASKETTPTSPAGNGSADANEQNSHEESAASDSADAAAPHRKGVGKRIDELTGNWRNAERERDAATARAAELERELQQLRAGKKPDTNDEAQPPPKREPDPSRRPTLEDFDFDAEAHAEAVANWVIEKREREREASRKETEQRQTLAEKRAAFEAEHDDFAEVAMDPTLPITREMSDAMLESDNPHAIAYYLGKNRAEAEEISQMSPTAQIRAIGRIEAKLDAPAAPAADPAIPPKPSPVSKAPAPPVKLAATTSASKKPEDMTMQEYDAWRSAQEKAKRGN
jgi:hypothetical protein